MSTEVQPIRSNSLSTAGSTPMSPASDRIPSGSLDQIEEDAAVSDTGNNSYGDHHGQTDEEEDISVDMTKDIQEIKAWDEGGASDCGYHQTVHETLMTIGGSVHKIAGEPSHHTRKALGAIGNWFQEASYAVRDIFRGKTKDIHEESNGVIKTTLSRLMGTKDADDEEHHDEKKDEHDPEHSVDEGQVSS